MLGEKKNLLQFELKMEIRFENGCQMKSFHTILYTRNNEHATKIPYIITSDALKIEPTRVVKHL